MKRLLPFLILSLTPGLLPGTELHVGANQPFAAVSAAIAAATAGDTVTVHAGIYREGALRVDKSIILQGIGRPVLDGEGKYQVVTITSPDVTISGFEIKNSGIGSLEDFAGIRITDTHHATVKDNQVNHCTFGIYLSKSKDCRIIDNEVHGLPSNEQNSGNGIHLWSCERVTVTGNKVRDHRDGIYLEFATESDVEDNLVEDNLRYGLHFMFSHGNAYRRNSFQRNGAGVAVMYSRHVEMTSNYFGHNWGSASYGLLLKDMTGGRICDNTFEHNSTGISMHGSNHMTIERNQFSENGWALQVLSSSSDNTFRTNNFSGNSFDVAADGELDNNVFENNYWDKYDGYDLKHDGIGDVPFRPVSLYAIVVGRMPASVLLLRSPIVLLLDQAEKAFPSMTPERVLDDKPAMHRHPLVPFHMQSNPNHRKP